jgi:hypothetical protein
MKLCGIAVQKLQGSSGEGGDMALLTRAYLNKVQRQKHRLRTQIVKHASDAENK